MIKPGWYKALSTVNIRREPRIIEQVNEKGEVIVTNRIGRINIGTRRRVVDVVTGDDNTTWGQVLESDGAGIGGMELYSGNKQNLHGTDQRRFDSR